MSGQKKKKKLRKKKKKKIILIFEINLIIIASANLNLGLYFQSLLLLNWILLITTYDIFLKSGSSLIFQSSVIHLKD